MSIWPYAIIIIQPSTPTSNLIFKGHQLWQLFLIKFSLKIPVETDCTDQNPIRMTDVAIMAKSHPQLFVETNHFEHVRLLNVNLAIRYHLQHSHKTFYIPGLSDSSIYLLQHPSSLFHDTKPGSIQNTQSSLSNINFHLSCSSSWPWNSSSRHWK